MPGRREGAIAVLSNVAGTDKSTYRRWLSQRIVHGPRGKNDQPIDLDAVEVGALKALIDQLGKGNGELAWSQINARLLATEPTADMRVVWRPYEAMLCLSAEEVGVSASVLRHRVEVVPVGPAAIEARRQLRLWAGARVRP